MGIMHKLLKRRHLECQASIMDLTKSEPKSKDNNCQDSEDDLVPKLATDDNQFTAEHIVQLCKFLAEKSQRNKSALKHLPHSQNLSKLKSRAPCQRESNSKQEIAEAVNHVPNSRLYDNDTYHLMAASAHPTNILGDKRITNLNVCEEFSTESISTSNKHQCAQEKRDILLKIRHQIFERKRQRQLLEQQLDVWRPW